MFFVFRKKAKTVESSHESLLQRAAALKEAVQAADAHAVEQAAQTTLAMNTLAQELGRISAVRQKLQAINIKF